MSDSHWKQTTLYSLAKQSGSPIKITPPEMIEKVYIMVLADRKLKVREDLEAIDI